MSAASVVNARETMCRVALVAALVASCSGDDAAPRPPVAAGDAAAPRGAPADAPVGRWVDIASITAPYFTDGDAGRGAARFAVGDWAGARDGFAAHLAAHPDASEADRARAQLLLGMAALKLRAWDEASDALVAAAPSTPLADYAYYQAARARLAADDLDGAVELARKVDAGSEYGQDAHLLAGDALEHGRRWSELADHDERYLAEYPNGPRRLEVRYRLARAYERTKRVAPEAVFHYRRLTVIDPRGQWGKRAKKRLKSLLRRLPRKERRAQQALAAGDYIERGMRLYDDRRHRKAAAEFARAVDAANTTPEDTCVASYYVADSWFRHRDRTRATPLFDAAEQACATAGNVDYQVKAAYQAGRSLAILGDWAGSRDRFAKAESIAAEHRHSFADDARVFRAEAAAMLGARDESRALLADVPTLYPDGDMRAEAMWRIGWMAYRDGRDREALVWLERQLADDTDDPDRKAHSRAQYWIGRVHARMGDASAAADAYVATARDYPLTYYALLALNRLREGHAPVYRTLLAELAGTSAAPEAPAQAFELNADAIDADPAAAQVLELYRLGLSSRAEAALVQRGRGRPAAGTPHSELMWIAALLHHRAQRYPSAVWITRWYAVDYKRAWPVGPNRIKWDIAYPRVFGEQIAAHAETYGYPAALQLAIVREESGFNPRIESRANAIGLSQLIRPTARRFGSEIGIRASARNLRNADKNLAIGARFLGFLWTKWTGRVGLIPPSYNAGEAAVARWLGERGDMALDEWIEAIPGDQARGYTKRVLGSYFTYSYLADGSVPVVPNDAVGAALADE